MSVYQDKTEFVNTKTYFLDRRWKRQTKPWRDRLGYYKRETRVTLSSPTPYVMPDAGSVPQTPSRGTARTAAYNRAYGRIVDAAQGVRENYSGDGETAGSAGLGVNIAQRKQAMTMMIRRIGQLLQFTQSVRKLRFGDAADALDMDHNEAKRRGAKFSRSKSFSDNWLEFHFGWSPLVSDIYACIDIMTRDFPIKPVKGRGSESYSVRNSSQYGFTEWKGKVKCQILADIRISNSDALLLSQLGLANPVEVLWDVVPWSFVLGWFSNASQVVSSISALYGIQLSNIAVTYLDTENYEYYRHTPWFGTERGLSETLWMERVILASLPGPSFQFKPFKGFSVTRGATALSLLLQQLSRR